MNFAQVDQIKDQQDGKGYAVKTQMFGTFIEIGGQTFTQNQKPTVKVKLADDQGVSHQVHLYGNNLPDATWLNRRACFEVSAFDGQGQGGPYVGYQGFWQNNAQTNQQPAQRPQQPPQPRQPANAPPANKSVDWDAKELREHRGYALHDAVTILVTLAELNKNASLITAERALELSELFLVYRYNGMAGMKAPATQPGDANPDWVGEDPVQPADDDIPFN